MNDRSSLSAATDRHEESCHYRIWLQQGAGGGTPLACTCSSLEAGETYTGPCTGCGRVNFPGSFGATLCPICRAARPRPEDVLRDLLIEHVREFGPRLDGGDHESRLDTALIAAAHLAGFEGEGEAALVAVWDATHDTSWEVVDREQNG